MLSVHISRVAATRQGETLFEQAHRTGLRCTSIHRFRAAAIFYPNFYPNRRRSGVERLYLLVTAANWNGRPGSVTSLPSWSCGFDSRRPLQLAGFFRLTVHLTAIRCGPLVVMTPRPVFPLVKCALRTELCRHEGLVGLPVVLPEVPAALKLVMHTRFRRPLHRRSLHRDVPRHRNDHDPHWLQGFPDRRDADGTVRSGPEAPKTRPARTPGIRRIARYPGGPGSCRPTSW